MTYLKDLQETYTGIIRIKHDHIIECCNKDTFTECLKRICKCKVRAGVTPRGKAFIRICEIEKAAMNKKVKDDRDA